MTDTSEPLKIKCSIHGIGTASVVCGHLDGPADMSLGFVENSSDPSNLQAWCDECEQMFLRERNMTEAFRAFNDMTVVCDGCYGRLKSRHSTQR